MIYFDILMTLIEDIIFTYFNFKISNISNKLYFLLSIFLCFIETFFFNHIILNNFLAIILLIFIHVIISYLCTKQFNLYNAIIPTIIISILLISNTMALIIVLIINDFNLDVILNTNQSIILLTLISRVLFLISSILFEKIQKKLFDIKLIISNDWVTFFIFSFSLLETFSLLYESIFYQTISHKTIYLLLFLVICILISFFILFFQIQKEYNNFLQLNNQLAKTRYYNESYSKLNSLSYQISQDKHDMFYVLIKIKHLLNSKDNTNDDIMYFINKYLNKLDYYDDIHTSSLPTYEAKLFSHFKELKNNGYDIKTIISIENKQYAENILLIDLIKNIFDDFIQYSTTKDINFYLYENNSYLILKISIVTSFIPSSFHTAFRNSYINKIKLKKYPNDTVDLIVLFNNSL